MPHTRVLRPRPPPPVLSAISPNSFAVLQDDDDTHDDEDTHYPIPSAEDLEGFQPLANPVDQLTEVLGHTPEWDDIILGPDPAPPSDTEIHALAYSVRTGEFAEQPPTSSPVRTPPVILAAAIAAARATGLTWATCVNQPNPHQCEWAQSLDREFG